MLLPPRPRTYAARPLQPALRPTVTHVNVPLLRLEQPGDWDAALWDSSSWRGHGTTRQGHIRGLRALEKSCTHWSSYYLHSRLPRRISHTANGGVIHSGAEAPRGLR